MCSNGAGGSKPIVGADATNWLTRYCPIVDGPDFMHSGAVSVLVDGMDALLSASVQGLACVISADQSDMECGAVRYSCSTAGGCASDSQPGYAGSVALSLDKTTFQNLSYVNYYAYVKVLLPPVAGSGDAGAPGTWLTGVRETND